MTLILGILTAPVVRPAVTQFRNVAWHVMTTFLTIGAILGSLITWVITKFFYDGQRRRYLRKTTLQSQRAIEIQDQFYATHAMLYLSALRALESGDPEGAKRDLASGAAGFYSQFSAPEQSQSIEVQKRDVELLAKTSQALRETLRTRVDDSAT